MNVPDDAPDLLHKNPETDEDEINEVFMDLYQMGREHLCYRILSCPFVESVWEAMMRPKHTLDDHNPIEFESRLDQLIKQSWYEIRPPTQQAKQFIDQDPSLLDVHSRLTHTFGPETADVMPERIVIYNLRLWVNQGLYHFWEHRLTGNRYALFNVKEQDVQLQGIVPETLLEVYAGNAQNAPYEYR